MRLSLLAGVVFAAGATNTGASIDAFVQLGAKLTAAGETAGGSFGSSVALSADGNTVLIGAEHDANGAGGAYVFTHSGSAWHQVGGRLSPSDGTFGGRFGASVALSADGNTALIGAPTDGGDSGAAWVFTRSGSTWTQVGSKLTPNDASGSHVEFGTSVALSGNATTALIGGPEDGDVGAAWIFAPTRSLPVVNKTTRAVTVVPIGLPVDWKQQGSKLTPSDEKGFGAFGSSVALATDGGTALIGGATDNSGQGAAWVFARSGSTWSQDGRKLTAFDEYGPKGQFGDAVTLSGDGTTVLIGATADEHAAGGAWVFTHSGTGWIQQGYRLTPRDERGAALFGNALALSSDGNTALIGGPNDAAGNGAAWLFTRTGTAWTQQGNKLTASDESGAGEFGTGVALSGDRATVLVGGAYDTNDTGAAWLFSSAPPVVAGLNPSSGPAGGGTLVTINGSHLTAASAVSFGTTAATLFKVVSDSQITALTPVGTPGSVDVTVTSPTGTSAVSGVDKFTYTTATTTATTSTTSATTTTTTKPTTAGKGPVARIVYATVVGKGAHRTLEVRIRVSEPDSARLQLFAHTSRLLTKTFEVKGGGNGLMTSLPRGTTRGTDQLVIRLVDTGGHQKTYTIALLVPS
jgi:hypothetical protein